MRNPILLYVDSVDGLLRQVVKVLYRLFGRYFRRVRLGPIEFELRGEASQNYRQVLDRLDKAGSHLVVAMDALDDLHTQYSNEKARILSLRREVEAKRKEQDEALADLETTRELLATDQKRLKTVLGFNDRRSKLVGFISGVLASVVGGLIFQFAPPAWEYFIEFLSL